MEKKMAEKRTNQDLAQAYAALESEIAKADKERQAVQSRYSLLLEDQGDIIRVLKSRGNRVIDLAVRQGEGSIRRAVVVNAAGVELMDVDLGP